jgi:hypothetical protein
MFLDDNSGPDHSKGVFIGVTVTFIIASILVVTRLVSRFGIIKHSGKDDYLIILAWVSKLACFYSILWVICALK